MVFFSSVWVMLVGFGLGAWLFLFLGYLFLLLGPATYCVWLINSFCICLSLCLSSRGFPPCPSLSIEATNGSASLCPFNLQTWRALPTFFLLPSLAAISACCFWGWVLIGWILGLIHQSSSLDWCSGIAAHERRSHLSKLCRMFRVLFCWDGCWTNVLASSTGFGFDGPFHLIWLMRV